ncbi:MAG: glycosyltransferase family 2 protein [Oceanococcaceae bacterium]
MTEAGGAPFRPALIVPVYNHAEAIGAVVAALQPLGLPCWLIDDGSDAACSAALRDLQAEHADWLHLDRLPSNQGKGRAVCRGFELAAAAGCSHALQVDADGQHAIADAKALLALAAAHPLAVICGVPVYDESVPRSRLYGRYITHVWVWIHTASLDIRDSMCGFRVYPLPSTLQMLSEEQVGARMDFDTDILVRLYWRGLEVINHPTRVHYPLDGVSHFDVLRDNLRISRMHTRLFFTMLWRRLGLGRRIQSYASDTQK